MHYEILTVHSTFVPIMYHILTLYDYMTMNFIDLVRAWVRVCDLANPTEGSDSKQVINAAVMLPTQGIDAQTDGAV